MPKTKDAFALKDFDRARILQRPFFKDFNFDKDLTDEKILSALSAQIGDSVADNGQIGQTTLEGFSIPIYDSTLKLEQKNATLRELRARLDKYWLRIGHHENKLRRYYQSKDEQSDKFNRGRDLSVSYWIVVERFVKNLAGYVDQLFDETETILRKRYRNRFAQRLKRARERAGLSRRDVAQMLGYTTSGFAELEKPRSEPNLTALIRLSRELNVSADWLLGLK